MDKEIEPKILSIVKESVNIKDEKGYGAAIAFLLDYIQNSNLTTSDKYWIINKLVPYVQHDKSGFCFSTQEEIHDKFIIQFMKHSELSVKQKSNLCYINSKYLEKKGCNSIQIYKVIKPFLLFEDDSDYISNYTSISKIFNTKTECQGQLSFFDDTFAKLVDSFTFQSNFRSELGMNILAGSFMYVRLLISYNKINKARTICLNIMQNVLFNTEQVIYNDKMHKINPNFIGYLQLFEYLSKITYIIGKDYYLCLFFTLKSIILNHIYLLNMDFNRGIDGKSVVNLWNEFDSNKEIVKINLAEVKEIIMEYSVSMDVPFEIYEYDANGFEEEYSEQEVTLNDIIEKCHLGALDITDLQLKIQQYINNNFIKNDFKLHWVDDLDSFTKSLIRMENRNEIIKKGIDQMECHAFLFISFDTGIKCVSGTIKNISDEFDHYKIYFRKCILEIFTEFTMSIGFMHSELRSHIIDSNEIINLKNNQHTSLPFGTLVIQSEPVLDLEVHAIPGIVTLLDFKQYLNDFNETFDKMNDKEVTG